MDLSKLDNDTTLLLAIKIEDIDSILGHNYNELITIINPIFCKHLHESNEL